MVPKLNVKISEDKMGFVERCENYRYGSCGSIEHIVGISASGRYFSDPCAFKGGEFVRLSDIENEVGVARYLKAKKPIYTVLGDGFIARVKIYKDFSNGIVIKDKSNYSIYSVSSLLKKDIQSGTILLKEVKEIPLSTNDFMLGLMDLISDLNGRDEFLTNRIEYWNREGFK